MKKILIAVIAMVSLVIMPFKVDAATTYKDYITIESYGKDKEAGRFIQIKANSNKITLNNEGAQQLRAYFLMENEKGDFAFYAENVKFQMIQGDSENIIDSILQVSDQGLKNDILEARFQVWIYMDFDDYKSKLVIDLDKMQLDENGKILNIDEIVTEVDPGDVDGGKVEDKTVEITADNSTITEELLTEIMNNKNKVTYESKKDDKVVYAWTFDGSEITFPEFNINLDLTVGAKDEVGITKLIPKTQEKPVILEFKHHGLLPAGTSVKVNVADTYKNGDKLTLYYYNEETKKLEEITTNIEVKDGFAEFLLEHCSSYVLTKSNTAPNNSQTSSMNVVLYGGIAAISLVGIILIAKSKKEIA